MQSGNFEKPVYLRAGKHVIQEVANVRDAIDFLEDWPERDRDLIHEVALRTCTMAHDGLEPLKAARDAIRSFGTKKGILEKEPAVRPWMIQKTPSGRVSA